MLPFVSRLVAAVNSLLGVTHVFGSSYHPQSQGYIEGRHQSINRVLAAYVNHFPGQWARWCKLAQWSLRAPPPREDRGGLSPYKLVAGLKSQAPLHELFC